MNLLISKLKLNVFVPKAEGGSIRLLCCIALFQQRPNQENPSCVNTQVLRRNRTRISIDSLLFPSNEVVRKSEVQQA